MQTSKWESGHVLQKGAVFAILFSSALLAQTITGSITGTVTDPTKAVVANVKIVATNTGTNLTYPTDDQRCGRL